MFDTLQRIKESWMDSRLILMHDDVNPLEKYTLLIPAQAVHSHHFTFLRNIGSSPPQVYLGPRFARELELPTKRIMFQGIASRYRVIASLAANAELLHRPEEVSISVSHVDVSTGLTDEELSVTTMKLGDLADVFKSGKITKNELIQQFTSKFFIPGHMPLVRGALYLLRGKLSTVELALALTKITNQTPAVLGSDLLSGTGYMKEENVNSLIENHGLEIMNASAVIQLWRSMEKVRKDELAEPMKISGLI